MSSLPGAYFYTNDIYADTAQCTDSTVGIWMLLLFIMVKRGTGTLVDTPKSLRLACRTTARNWNRAVEELTRYEIAEIEDVQGCDLIRVHSSRMERTIEEALDGYNSEMEVRKKRFTFRAKKRHEKSASNTVNEPESPENEDSVTPSRALDIDKDLDTTRREDSGKKENGSPREETRSVAVSKRRPSTDEVEQYMTEYGSEKRISAVWRDQAERWMDHYTTNGWKVGRNSMKDWKAAVRNWCRNLKDGTYGKNSKAVGTSGRGDRGFQDPGGKESGAGRSVQAGVSGRPKRDGELSPREYLARAGFTASEIHERLGAADDDHEGLAPVPESLRIGVGDDDPRGGL